MTAIAGLSNFDGRPAAPALARMLAAQRVYGPDDSSHWAEGFVGLGRNLMRILPEDRFDCQPLEGGGGRYRLVADVRLDDRDDLAAALGIADGAARELSDAALVLAAFEQWGPGCFARLYGDYAVAIWDADRRAWLLARDPLGGRPLHYHHNGALLAFASMPKGLHALEAIPYAPDADLLARSLEGIFPEPQSSCFRHILRVPVGCCLIADAGGVREAWRWSPPHAMLRLERPGDYHAALREQLDRAVQARLRGAETVATQCSGGLDSGAVTATAARLQGATGRRVVAFTAVPRPDFDGRTVSGRNADEGALAASVTALYANVEHVRVDTRGRTPLDGMDRAFSLYEEPVGSLANATWGDAINDAVRARGIGVLLVGQQGNFTISYDGQHGPASWLARGAWGTLAREARAMARAGRPWRGIIAQAIRPRLPDWLWQAMLRRADPMYDRSLTSLLDPTRRESLGLASGKHLPNGGVHHFDSRADRLHVLQRGDGANYIKGMLAEWRIDQRDPTADRRLVEFCLSVPDAQYLRDGIPSAMARVGLADRLSRAVIESRERGLQSADWHLGMADGHDRLVAEVERIAQNPAAAQMVDVARLRRLAADFPREGWDKPEVQAEYRSGLLRALAAAHFLRLASPATVRPI